MLQPAQPRRHRRWPLIAASLAIVVLLAVGGGIGWWFFGGSESWARSRWQPPREELLSSMRDRPTPGWTSAVAALGLPSGSQITNGDVPGVPGPMIGTLGERAFLMARSPAPEEPRWSLVGVDARDGRALFPPVGLSTTTLAPSCFVNGSAVVCISDDQVGASAWVIDTQTGELSYTGPTDVRLVGEKLRATRAGGHLVAVTKEQGVFGIGPHAETTWFVPGVGVVANASSELATQGDGKGNHALTIFSLVDGRVIPSELPRDGHLEQVEFFEGGFAAYVVTGADPFFVQFFDEDGKLSNDKRFKGTLGGSTANLTALLEAGEHFGIYGPDGAKLLEVAGRGPEGMKLVGTTLYVGAESNLGTQPYDLRNGAKGTACDFTLAPIYLGSDGSIAVRAPVNPRSDDLAKAFDLTSCQMVWSIPRSAGSLGRITRVGNTLVQLSNDGTELMSLVAPH